MPVPVNMPQLGESVTEGTVTRWLKQVGDAVQADEPLLEVSTDKVDTEIPAPASGVLLAIHVGEDTTVAVGTELGVIGQADEAPTTPAPAAPAPASSAAVESPLAPAPPPQQAVTAPPAQAAVGGPPPQAAVAAPAQPHAIAPATSEPFDFSPEYTSPHPSRPETPVVLPALGESVTEGTVTRWLKKVGDEVSADEPLLEVSTDKVDTEIPSPVSGTLLEIRVAEDETAEVGQALGIVGSPRAEAPGAAEPAPPAPAPVVEAPAPVVEAPAPPPAAAPSPAPSPVAAEPAARAAHAAGAPSDLYVTPLVRKLAGQLGVDLSKVRGSGVGGRITKQDVFDASHARPEPAAPPVVEVAAPAQPAATPAAATPAPAAPAAGAAATTPPAAAPAAGERTEPMTRLRKVIAQRMVESLKVSAQLTTVVEADLSRIALLRRKHQAAFTAREGVKLSFMPFLVKAAIEALKQFPVINASMDQDAGTITFHDAVHMGIAVDTERGLLVPVIRNAENLNIAGLARKIADVAERTRTNKVSPDELSGGTFTLTNTGSRGALFDTPIINQPQVAILGTGAMVRRPVVVTDDTGADSIAIRSMMFLALTYDHRLVDGADAARFLSTLKTRLEGGDFEAELA